MAQQFITKAEEKELTDKGFKLYACIRKDAADLAANPFGSDIADREQFVDRYGYIWYKRTEEELAKAAKVRQMLGVK